MKFFRMERIFLRIMLVCAMVLGFALNGSAQEEQKEKTPEQYASAEAERLGNLLKLEYWQVFYVDSTLQHDYAALKKEIEDLRAAKVENADLYRSVQDKWMEKIDSSFQKYFTKEQWDKYLKSGAAKNQKNRAKRKEKAGGKK